MLKILKWFCNLMVFYAENDTGGGGTGQDTVSGGTGADTTTGGQGNDTTAGGQGKDTTAGGGGQDTVAGGGGADKFKFPENWREGLGAGDVKKIEKLSRYATPQAVADALLAVQERIGKGELRSQVPFPEKGTDQEKNDWRKERGIPEKPTAYLESLKLTGDRKVTPEDQPRVEAFITKMHGRNAAPEVVSAAIDAYYDDVEARTNERMELDGQQVQQSRDSLIAEMGLPEFKTNLNLVTAMFDMMPAAVKEKFTRGRLSDGKPILGDPDVFKGLAEWARAINPAAALVPGSGANTAGAIDEEIAKIEKDMRTDRAAYNKDAAKQKRYLELIDARDRAGTQKK